MNESVSPCDDFYNFACGNFGRKIYTPGTFFQSTFSLAQDHLNEQLRVILSEEPKEGEPKPFAMVKQLYKSCLNISIAEERGWRPLRKLVESVGGWPVVLGDQWNQQEATWRCEDVIKKFRDAGLQHDYIFYFGVGANLTNSFARTIEVRIIANSAYNELKEIKHCGLCIFRLIMPI